MAELIVSTVFCGICPRCHLTLVEGTEPDHDRSIRMLYNEWQNHQRGHRYRAVGVIYPATMRLQEGVQMWLGERRYIIGYAIDSPRAL